MAERTILHVDMDAFFVSVELLDHPELRGRPVIVGGSGPRGVVAAASYEARSFGVHSAMPSSLARRCCPQAVFLHGRHHRYREVSARVMAVFASFTPLVEPLSLDEAFLDVTGRRRRGTGAELAAAVRDRVRETEGLTCSVGVAPNKFLAKLASEAAKPTATPTGPVFGSGVHVIAPGRELAFLHPLPVQALWGVGPATRERLHRMGVMTVGDLAATSLSALTGALGRASGTHLHQLAHGVDDRDVVADRAPKSIGHEETFTHDLYRPEALERELVRLGDAVAGRLRRHGLTARTVTLKVRFGDFRTVTRARTLDQPTDSAPVVVGAAKALMSGIDPTPGVRLLGVSASGLSPPGGSVQLRLEGMEVEAADGSADPAGAAGAPGWPDAEAAVDAIRVRFGPSAIGPATLVGPDGPGTRRPGDQQWGPPSDAESAL